MRAVAVLLIVLAALGSIAQDAGAQVGRNQHLLIPDLASEHDLLMLPHLNTTLVNGIVERSPFKTMLHVDEYLRRSLSKAQLAGLYVRFFLPLNLNAASRSEILLVPGVDARLAQEFESHRPYRTLSQFRSEIGKHVDANEVRRLEQYVFVPIDLNTASDDDLQTIPGLSPRMAREFKRHRPYQSFARFRQESRKYVSDKEVARLERYLTIN
jgi:predicted DNA-binding helix-hairpin-helix protein